MKTYKEWSPTEYDRKGLNLPDRHNWLVCPVILTRDSDCLEESNFEACLSSLGRESETLERHEFNHWACGWFAILLLHPARQSEGEAIEERLEDYPVLNEDDFSRREWDAYAESWAKHGAREFVRELSTEFELSDAAESLLVLEGGEPLLSYFESLIPSGDYYDPASGCYPRVGYAADRADRDGVAKLLREIRLTRNSDPTKQSR